MNNTQMNSFGIYKDISDSPKIFASCQKIGEMFSLHIDQIGELDAQVREVLKGQAKSSSFINDIIKYLEINRSLADEIATEVNKEIFNAIKSQMQSDTQENKTEISDLERIGDFRILKEGDNSKNGNGLGMVGVENIQADNLLESPPATAEKKITPVVPPNLPIETSPSKPTQIEKTQTVPLPVIQKLQVPPQPEKPITPITPTPPIPKKSYEKDPYREPF